MILIYYYVGLIFGFIAITSIGCDVHSSEMHKTTKTDYLNYYFFF